MKRGKFILYTGALLLPIKVLPARKKVTLLDEWNNLTEHQKAIRDLAWNYGQRYGFEKTLVAIAWQESSFGLVLENPKEPSGGVFGNGYTTAARRHFNIHTVRIVDDEKEIGYRLEYTLPDKKQLAYIRNRLIAEPLFSAYHAELQLKEAVERIGHPFTPKFWEYVWAYYNGGTNCMKEPFALRYADDILAKVRVINQVKYKGA